MSDRRPTAVAAALMRGAEVAELVGCSVRTIQRLYARGRMPAPIRVASLVKWRRADIEKWIAAGCSSARA